MKRFLTFVLLAVAAFYGYRYWTNRAPSFGATSSRPIGAYEDINAYLKTKQRMMSGPIGEEGVRDVFGPRFEGRGDLQAERYDREGSTVTVVRAAGGKLLGVAVRFKSGRTTFTSTGQPAAQFTAHYWTDLFGAPPTFKGIQGELRANIQKGSATCSWVKDVSNGEADVTDAVTFVIQKARLSKIQGLSLPK